MIQTITENLKTIVTEALDAQPTITAEDALAFVADDGYVFVDLRENVEQSKSGVISGAVSCARGLLEYSSISKAHCRTRNWRRTKHLFSTAHLAAKSASQMG